MAGGPANVEIPRMPEGDGGAKLSQRLTQLKDKALASVTKHKETLTGIFGSPTSEIDQQNRRKLLRNLGVGTVAVGAAVTLGPEAAKWLTQAPIPGQPKPAEAGKTQDQLKPVEEKDKEIAASGLSTFLLSNFKFDTSVAQAIAGLSRNNPALSEVKKDSNGNLVINTKDLLGKSSRYSIDGEIMNLVDLIISADGKVKAGRVEFFLNSNHNIASGNDERDVTSIDTALDIGSRMLRNPPIDPWIRASDLPQNRDSNTKLPFMGSDSTLVAKSGDTQDGIRYDYSIDAQNFGRFSMKIGPEIYKPVENKDKEMAAQSLKTFLLGHYNFDPDITQTIEALDPNNPGFDNLKKDSQGNIIIQTKDLLGKSRYSVDGEVMKINLILGPDGKVKSGDVDFFLNAQHNLAYGSDNRDANSLDLAKQIGSRVLKNPPNFVIPAEAGNRIDANDILAGRVVNEQAHTAYDYIIWFNELGLMKTKIGPAGRNPKGE